MKETMRKAQSDELRMLKNIWKTVFGDTDAFIDLFFRHYGADDAIVAQIGGEIAAAGYLLPCGSLRMPDGAHTPCAMIYSVAVLPEYRSRGLGAELSSALIAEGHAAGHPAVVLRPASDGLFGYYARRTELREWFYASEYTGYIVPGGGKLTQLTTVEYSLLRGELLAGIAHIEPDERAMSFQSAICDLTGGGLFAVTAPGCGDACAVIEPGEMVAVKELLSLDAAQGAAAAIARAFPAREYSVRTLAHGGLVGARFGMLAATPELGVSFGDAWYGPAFD